MDGVRKTFTGDENERTPNGTTVTLGVTGPQKFFLPSGREYALLSVQPGELETSMWNKPNTNTWMGENTHPPLSNQPNGWSSTKRMGPKYKRDVYLLRYDCQKYFNESCDITEIATSRDILARFGEMPGHLTLASNAIEAPIHQKPRRAEHCGDTAAKPRIALALQECTYGGMVTALTHTIENARGELGISYLTRKRAKTKWAGLRR